MVRDRANLHQINDQLVCVCRRRSWGEWGGGGTSHITRQHPSVGLRIHEADGADRVHAHMDQTADAAAPRGQDAASPPPRRGARRPCAGPAIRRIRHRLPAIEAEEIIYMYIHLRAKICGRLVRPVVLARGGRMLRRWPLPADARGRHVSHPLSCAPGPVRVRTGGAA